jgi:Ca-activated chloride channel family protein
MDSAISCFIIDDHKKLFRKVRLPDLMISVTSRATVTWVLVFAGCFGLCAAHGLRGQTPSPASQHDADLVKVFFTVRNSSGALASGLSKDDFLILEDGHPQSIQSLNNASIAPLTLCLMFETTNRMQASLQSDKATSLDLVRQFSSGEYSAAVVSFDSEVTLEQSETSKIERLQRGLDFVQIRPEGGNKGLIYDAIYATASDLLEKPEGFKVMLIFTSGVDDGGKEKLDDAIHAVQKAGTLCYVIIHLGPWSSTRISQDMKAFAESTGGSSFPVRAGDILNNWEKMISSELRGQYFITYKPDVLKHDGGFRKIELKMKDRNSNYTIHTRSGYFAPPN